MAVDQPDGLEERGADDRTDEGEPAPSEVSRKRRSVGEDREIGPEGARAVPEGNEPAGVPDGRADLRRVPDDPWIAKQAPFGGRGEPCDPVRIEASERAPVTLPLAEDRRPGEAGLSGLEDQELEERPVVARRAAPLPVVVAAQLGTRQGPAADRHRGAR